MRFSDRNHISNRLLTTIIIALAVLTTLTSLIQPYQPARGSTTRNSEVESPTFVANYMPMIHKTYPTQNQFGIESTTSLADPTLLGYTKTLRVGYTRLNDRISWRELQPEENDAINWSLLTDFEIELRTLLTARITPIVIVDDYPYWATDNTVRLDGLPTSCGPLLPARYDDFAIFMQALVQRYSSDEFNVHIWEMGNEPDVDPNLVPPNNLFGCWGDWDDPFYNGRAYGQMLMQVTPAIKTIDPLAQVWIGGLLLDSPNTIDDNIGQPEDFFRGILEAGAAPYFDMVPYHVYVNYSTTRVDRDLYSNTAWDAWGGHIRGKARFLRAIMAEYNVVKPLLINEISLVCSWCLERHIPGLYDMQANLVPRSFPRAMADGIPGFIWYTLPEIFWRYCSLLDESSLPKPAYLSYQTFMEMVSDSDLVGQADYGTGIEAYTFTNEIERIDIIFTIEDIQSTILIPTSNFIAAYDRFGNSITPTLSGSDYSLPIQYEPIYLVRTY